MLPEQKEYDGWGKKRKLAFTGFDPYDPEYSDDEEYESMILEKMCTRATSSPSKRRRWKSSRPRELLPSSTARSRSGAAPKTKDCRFDHLVSHAEDVAIRGEDYMIRGQHAALAKALTPV
ncbi:hypothetical protein D1007_00848 [Hordeum vulgare]|nr:hypothetical protein D1007_00848 [Hordeum vulgare]